MASLACSFMGTAYTLTLRQGQQKEKKIFTLFLAFASLIRIGYGMAKNRLETEKQVVETMVRLYCTHTHDTSDLCPSCKELLSYAHERIDRCPEGAGKPFCSACAIHCYEPHMREQIRTVMRYSGPRMLWHHPLVAMRHLLSSMHG